MVLWFILRSFADQWVKFRNTPLTVEPRWGMIVLSAAITLSGFVVLIETWRRMIVAWGDTLSFSDASRIWFTSNLVRYLPGSTVVQLGAMAELSRRRRISPAAATGAAVINTAVNIATGFIVALVAGYGAMNKLTGGRAVLGVVAASAVLLAVLAIPILLPPVLIRLRTWTGRDLTLNDLPLRAIYISLTGNVIAWVLYGMSYRALIAGLIGSAPGATLEYISVYAAAYVLGYIVFVLPAGAGVREGVQIDGLTLLGLASPKQAVLISAAARLLSMILEVVPGLVLLSRGTRRPNAGTD